MLEYILAVILVSLLFWILYWYFTVSHFERYLKHIPGPTPLPLVGNALEFSSSSTVLSTLMKYHRKFQGNFKVYIGLQPHIFISEAKDLEFLFNSSTIIRKSTAYDYLNNWLGTGLLTGWGNKWRKHRKIITPAFHFKILEEFIDVFNTAGDILVNKLEEQSKKPSVDIYPLMTRCALDIICESTMGTSVNAQENNDSEYFKCVNILLRILIDRTFSAFLSNDFLYRFSTIYQEEKRALKVVHGYSRSVISSKMAEFVKSQKDKTQGPEVDALDKKKKKAFLDLLLEYSSNDPNFTYEDICEEVDTFMFAGHDTTATAISFALFALANNPDVQTKVCKELQDIFSDDPMRSATYKDLQNMRYMELAIKESLRVYTTIPFVGRSIENDVDWNGHIMPKGAIVNLLLCATHNSNVYPDPEKFDPERFTLENMQGKNPFLYLPFSAGLRNCIGQKYAMLEMKSIISNVLRNFELIPVIPQHKILMKSEAVLKSDNGIIIRLKKRN